MCTGYNLTVFIFVKTIDNRVFDKSFAYKLHGLMQVLKCSIALQLNYLETFFPIHIVMTPIIFNEYEMHFLSLTIGHAGMINLGSTSRGKHVYSKEENKLKF